MESVAEKTKSNEKEHSKNIDINDPNAITATSSNDDRLKEKVQLAENIINELAKNNVTVSEANFILEKAHRLIGKFYNSARLVPSSRNQERNLSESA